MANKFISIQEYDAMMAYIKPKLQALWIHENEERKKRGNELINEFQFGFPIIDIAHYKINNSRNFYLIFNSSFLKIISSSIIKAIDNFPDKFGTGDANDVIDALYNVSGYHGDREAYIGYLEQNACCYIVYRENEKFDDILRLDIFRLILPCKDDSKKYEFIGGLLHALKHFSINGKNLSTGNDIHNIFDVYHVVYLIGMAFGTRDRKKNESNSCQTLSDAIMHIVFYKEEISSVFFLVSYYKKKSVKNVS
ncbi:MAG: hypothetical protein IAA73_06975 [Bacteroidetes bacterium]|uniref:Uncharacterized protein n=1 Tax=Candidatus Gallipaludibacter merdavium TaxID=2840839 RepID=A0A9D9N4N7_9BACT|nr:hypothetical protein [Candidatus Gallipaludibacter merdavium]